MFGENAPAREAVEVRLSTRPIRVGDSGAVGDDPFRECAELYELTRDEDGACAGDEDSDGDDGGDGGPIQGGREGSWIYAFAKRRDLHLAFGVRIVRGE